MIKTFARKIKLFSSPRKEFYLFLKSLFEVYPENLKLYDIALIHKSASILDSQNNWVNNERLEYLGDAILGAIIAEFLYNRYPNKDEGFLTQMRSKLVNRSFLTDLTYKIGLNHHIQSNTKNTIEGSHIYGDAFEAIIGAFYLDKGYYATKHFIIKKLLPEYVDLNEVQKTNTNFKSQLIEWGQKVKKEINFETTEHSDDNDNNTIFKSQIFIEKDEIGNGTGSSKKEAQQKASEDALKKLKEIYPSSL